MHPVNVYFHLNMGWGLGFQSKATKFKELCSIQIACSGLQAALRICVNFPFCRSSCTLDYKQSGSGLQDFIPQMAL